MTFASYEHFLQHDGWAIGRDVLGVASDAFNACERVLDRHCGPGSAAPALIVRDFSGGRRSVTFGELRELAGRVASALDALGVRRGERVFTLLEPGVHLHAVILGAVRAGAIAGPLFSAFGGDAVRARLSDSGACVLVVSGPLLGRLRPALADLPHLRHVIVVGEAAAGSDARERPWDAVVGRASPERAPERTSAQDPMLLHYTSGTTGAPKGVLHVHEALVGHAATARVALSLRPEDVYWCTADPGWVTGTSYGIFGPLALGVRSIVYSGGFDPEAWYRTIQEERVTTWYTSPTALRMLMREGTAAARRHDLSSLRHVCSVGEPLNPAVIEWAREALGRTVHDTWWQTETGCAQIVNYPFMAVRPGSMGRPFAGVTAAVLSPDTFEPVDDGVEGLLALRRGWPSMFRGYWGRQELYESRFRNGWYVTGDRARRDGDGYYWFVARDDDVINTSGHLVGPFEVESALLSHGRVAEAAAFSAPDEAGGERVVVQVVLLKGESPSKELERDLKTAVRRRVGPYAVPRDVVFVPRLPRTRSGKIMRRVARADYLGLPIGDRSSLED